MPPPHFPTILVDNSDNERDADDHQQWCLRNLKNPIFGRTPKRAKHAPLELVCACFTGPLPYSPWSPRHCCPSKSKAVKAPTPRTSSQHALHGERFNTSVAVSEQPQRALVPEAASKGLQLGARPDATSLQADPLCHQPSTSDRPDLVISRQVSAVGNEESEACASASQLLATMLSGENGQNEDRVSATPEVVQGQNPFPQPSPSPGLADVVPRPRHTVGAQSSALSSRPTQRASLPISFDDNVDSPVNGGHSVSSAIMPQPGTSLGLESLTESFRPEGEEQHSEVRSSDLRGRKRRVSSPPAEQPSPAKEYDNEPRQWQERGHQQDLAVEQEYEEYQSQDEGILMGVQERSRPRQDDDNVDKAYTSKRARQRLDNPPSPSRNRKTPVVGKQCISQGRRGSLQYNSASGPSPPPSSPIEPSPTENTRSPSPSPRQNPDQLSSPTPSMLSSSAVPSSPITGLSATPLPNDDGNVDNGAEATPIASSSSKHANKTTKRTSQPPNQSSLEAHLVDIEGYLERDLKGFSSRLSY